MYETFQQRKATFIIGVDAKIPPQSCARDYSYARISFPFLNVTRISSTA